MSVAAPAPSPQNGPSLKRPQEDGLSTTSKSPGQNSKKPRLNGDVTNGNGSRDIGKGGRWMVEKLEELERLYKAVVKATTVILQYQTFVIRVQQKEARTLPVHLQRRIKIAWGSFDATRRQIQAYMTEAAQEALTPSSRSMTIPIPLPPSNASLSVPHPGEINNNLPLASPIPLAAATMLSFDQQPQQSQPIPAPLQADSDAKPFSFDLGQGQGQSNVGGGNMMDLQGINIPGMDMNDLAALLQQGSQGFSLDSLMGNAAQPPQQPAPEGAAPVNQTSNPAPAPVSAPDTTQNDETEQLLAQLGAFTEAQQNPPATAQGGDTIADDDMDALLASLGGADGQDFANFDFSASLDMGNMGEMAGLFNTSTTADAQADQNAELVQKEVPTDPPVAAPSEPTATVEPKKEDPPQAQPQPEPQTQAQAQPAEPFPGMDDVDFSAINMDDFNFGGEEDGENGIGMSGDEFESLLASFN